MFFTTNRMIISVFIILLTGSIVFAMERILFVDASLILTRIINYDTLQIQEHRYGSFITQSFPLLASKLGLPLKTIVIIYSLSFNLFYLVAAILVVYKFRQTALGILMAFYYLLFVSDNFFWTNNEVHQGIAWMFIALAFILWMNEKKFPVLVILPVWILISFLAIFSHPLVVFPFIFLWIFLLLKTGTGSKRNGLLYSLPIVFLCLFKFYLSTKPSESFYDIEKLEAVSHPTIGKIFSSLQSGFAHELLERIFTDYWMVPLLLVAGLISAWRQRSYKTILLTLLFVLGYFIALCMTFHEFTRFYMESELMPLSIITSSLFVYYSYPTLKNSIAILVLAFIFMIRFASIAWVAPTWVERRAWIESTLKKMREKKINKAIIFETGEINKKLVMNWGVPMESLLASAIHGDKPQLSFVVATGESLQDRFPLQKNQLIGTHTKMDNSIIDHCYFRFDTTSHYVVLVP